MGIRTSCFFADFCCLQNVIDEKLYELLGERTAADDEKPVKKKKEKPVKVEVGNFTDIID